MRIIRFINTVRFIVFLISICALGCHIVQCALLGIYQQQVRSLYDMQDYTDPRHHLLQAKIPSWMEAGHWQV